eukprot:1194532-Prorocentrum_minimum.AAC.2
MDGSPPPSWAAWRASSSCQPVGSACQFSNEGRFGRFEVHCRAIRPLRPVDERSCRPLRPVDERSCRPLHQ